MKIIPAIDVMNGRCVRLAKGDYNSQTVYGDPLEMAKIFEDNGIVYLHVVDLDGAKAGKVKNLKTVEKIASQTNLIIDFGGGIKSRHDLELILGVGVAKVTLGSIAVENPAVCIEWIEEFGAEKFILGADCLNRKIKTSGWLKDSQLEVTDFIQSYEHTRIEEVICTDISKDGMLNGPSLNLYAEILEKTQVQLIASGGVSSVQDLEALKKIGCSGVIIGKALYEQKITLGQLQKFI
ncbi:1-(5-phosphoribosyl)-5-[(5-phosphoribosylamino)methylideneamino]imidazole-4-carboxamide isomerase [Chryseobacterium sp. 6424]|uniref:1-(5-phosphoribosyl)-5-[(5- phosphoribosylamino)methylideneamino]imidazole-4- carboxamide isomerase n=1 Tax=Chryseobacterium sp. 6424 TaxID=2039166 RepID=UPI000EFB5CB5|nr:1-(5-phosphoribosyl)-5-[(5-phosphoribosylamino)methylideneamino]imidazole-4-carboxamide isomerase [Chryseobacterium sp. 6424]AYO57642.1 1-(5-phosphoribosyl)-5-[(5-phosphoribosylamino)methylideneamino]imidazole-4-carboxamide isomerase [Chryseobacterium sp. 6424]